jgi:hypothetical protein
MEPGHRPGSAPDAIEPVGALRFSELDPHWQQVLTTTYLSVVLVRDATEMDIEELFSRLNKGEPLTAAERRNAMGGDMVRLIRDVVTRPFFACLAFSNGRYEHHDLAAGMLAIEAGTPDDTGGSPDAGTDAGGAEGLDRFVRDRREVSEFERRALLDALDGVLEVLTRVFSPADSRLASPAEALEHYRAARSGTRR